MSQSPVIKLTNVTVVYNEGTPNEVVALDNISLSFYQGESVMITGGNGSGKTTLLKAIAGTAPLKSGSVFLCGKDVTHWKPHKRARLLSYVYQDAMLGTCPNLTVFENLCLATSKPWWLLSPQALTIPEGQAGLLERTGLPLATKAAAPVNVLSGGQRQALSVVLAYSKKRPVVLLDEFTSSLDESIEKNIIDFIQFISLDHKTVTLAVTHTTGALNAIMNRHIQLDMGKVNGKECETE